MLLGYLSLHNQLTRWHNSLNQASEMQVRLENLFDQASGSGRNVAIVIEPLYSSGIVP